jgi:hypothetical protein
LVVQVARGIVLVLLVTVALVVSLRGDEPGQAATYGLASLAILLISPLAWGHYYVLALPAVLCVPLWLGRRGHPAAAKAVAAGLPALSWAHYVLMPWSGPIGLLGLGTTLWFVAACAYALLVLNWSRHDTSSPRSDLRSDIRHAPTRGNHERLHVPLSESPTRGASKIRCGIA